MGIEIGENSNIQDNSVLHTTNDSRFSPGGRKLVIGNDITIGHACIIHACTIEDLCLVGMGSTLLDACIVHTGAMIGANSLVPLNKELEGGFLWVGNPVKKVRKLKDSEKEFLKFSAESYAKLKQRHIASQS